MFNKQAHLAKPLDFVGKTNVRAIKKHILDLEANGGTNMSSGMDMATSLLNKRKFLNSDGYENRIIFVTDAQPNIAKTSNWELDKIVRRNSDRGIYSTFIGVGIDFNTNVVENITKSKGCNYYSFFRLSNSNCSFMDF